MSLKSQVEQWWIYGERGLSSQCIATTLAGVGPPSAWKAEPSDPADFRRCELLLESVPLLRLTFSGMATVSPQWAALVDRWDDIRASMLAEVPDYLSPMVGHHWSAPLTYRLMRDIIEGSWTKRSVS